MGNPYNQVMSIQYEVFVWIDCNDLSVVCNVYVGVAVSGVDILQLSWGGGALQWMRG